MKESAMTRAQQYRNFWWALAVSIDSGLPLLRALNIICRRLSNDDEFNRKIKELPLAMEVGGNFSKALANTSLFSRAEINLIRAGEVCQNLDIVLWRIVHGDISSRADQYEYFFRTFGTLLTSGVPTLQALQICMEKLDKPLKKAVKAIHDAFKEGETFAAPMDKSGAFSALEVNLVDVGEETGALDQMLLKLANLSRPYKFG